MVSTGVATYFGFSAGSQWHQAQSDCKTACGAGSLAQSEKTDASTTATISTIMFVASGALLATAVVLWVTAPKKHALEVSPAVARDALGFFARGTF